MSPRSISLSHRKRQNLSPPSPPPPVNKIRRRRHIGGGEARQSIREVKAARVELGRPVVVLVCGSLIYYHCAYRDANLLSLLSDVLIFLLCPPHHPRHALPPDKHLVIKIHFLWFLAGYLWILEWQISQDTANGIAACLANTIGAAESVLRVAATAHDKRLFFKVVLILYLLSVIGRSVAGATVAYAGLRLFRLYIFFAQSSQLIDSFASGYSRRRDSTAGAQDAM